MHHQHHLLKHRGFVTKIAILVLAILFGVLVWNTTHRQTIQLASFPDAPSVYSDFPKCKSPAQISVLTSEYKLAAKLATAAGQKSYASEINKKLTTVLRSLSSAQVSLIKAQNQLDAASTTLAKANSTVADRTKALQDNTVLSKEKALKSSLASAIKVQGPASKTYNAKKSAYDAIVAKIDAITVQKDTLSKTYDDIFKVTFEERFALRDKALAVLNQFTAMPTCPKTETPNQCLDGIDNDRDAKTDCDDSECSVTQACIDKKNGIGIPTNAGMDPNNGTGGPTDLGPGSNPIITTDPGTSTDPVQPNKKVCCVCAYSTDKGDIDFGKACDYDFKSNGCTMAEKSGFETDQQKLEIEQRVPMVCPDSDYDSVYFTVHEHGYKDMAVDLCRDIPETIIESYSDAQVTLPEHLYVQHGGCLVFDDLYRARLGVTKLQNELSAAGDKNITIHIKGNQDGSVHNSDGSPYVTGCPVEFNVCYLSYEMTKTACPEIGSPCLLTGNTVSQCIGSDGQETVRTCIPSGRFYDDGTLMGTYQ